MEQRPSILIIDDNQEIARGLAVRFRALDYDVELVHDGAAGLSAAFGSRPSLIMLDLRMPVMNGVDVLQHLRAREETANIPVVVLSANTMEKTVDQVLDLGASCFVDKPYDVAHLMRTVQTLVHQNKSTMATVEVGSRGHGR